MKIVKRGLAKRKKIIIAIFAVLVLGVIVAFAFGLFDKEVEQEEPIVYHSQLTGEKVEQSVSERPVLAVIFNNSEEARPQSGLASAGIVFETVTEGGITRYLAFYQEELPEEIGPVRSLRQHFLDWIMGFDASFAHVGGSADSLEVADQRQAKSLNQFSYDGPYFRTNDRPAPHNMYVRTQDLTDLQDELGHEHSQFDEIPRSSDSPSQEPQAATIEIDFSSPSYLAEFRYDPTSNNYSRYLAGQPHVDASTNQPISVKNVVVIRTTGAKALGSGEALVFKDGNVLEVTWQKTSHNKRIKIFDNENNEIPLNRGSTWFAALPADRPVTY